MHLGRGMNLKNGGIISMGNVYWVLHYDLANVDNVNGRLGLCTMSYQSSMGFLALKTPPPLPFVPKRELYNAL